MIPRVLAASLAVSLLGNAVLVGMLIGRRETPPTASGSPAPAVALPDPARAEYDFNGTGLSDESWKLDSDPAPAQLTLPGGSEKANPPPPAELEH